jgi:phosphatidylglycerophosphatase C
MTNPLQFSAQDLLQAKEYGLALFDFDGTITKRDSFIDFIVFMQGGKFKSGLDLILHPKLAFKICKYLLKNFPHAEIAREFFRHYFNNKTEQQLDDLYKEFQPQIQKLLNLDALQRIHWHQQQQHLVIVVSASPEGLIAPFCEKLGVKLIATKLQKVNGIYTGELVGVECNNGGKVVLLEQQIGAIAQYSNVFAYGDSPLDLPMLALASSGQSYYKCLPDK